MADNQLAGTGHKSEFWLSPNALVAGLVKMNQVTNIGIPKTTKEWIETSHLDSVAREYAPSLPDPEEIEITLNYRPGSDTDLAIQSAADDSNPRAVSLRVAIRGTLVRKFDFLAYVTYNPADDVNLGDKMESTVTLRPTGAVTAAVIP